MLTVTIQDILTKGWDELNPTSTPYSIYVFRDQEAVLYIGRSVNPFKRLTQHLRISRRSSSGASIGVFYQEYKDLSVHWQIDLYTIAECESLLSASLIAGERAEVAMIQHLHPHLNEINNPCASPLPERYQLRSLYLENNAVDYMNF